MSHDRAPLAVQDGIKSLNLSPWCPAVAADTGFPALSLNAINGGGSKNYTSTPLAQALGLQMADWWAPPVGGNLGSVSKALIGAALAEDRLQTCELKTPP